MVICHPDPLTKHFTDYRLMSLAASATASGAIFFGVLGNDWYSCVSHTTGRRAKCD
jgi:hypothetical protein